jgi:hypothetical protein
VIWRDRIATSAPDRYPDSGEPGDPRFGHAGCVGRDLESLVADRFDSGSRLVAVPGRGGSWLRSLLPGLWGATPRVLVIGEHDAALFLATTGFRSIKRELWRGAKTDLEIRRLLGDRVLRVRLTGTRRRLQVDGKADVRKVLQAVAD